MKIEELRIGNLVMIGGKVITMDIKAFHAVIHGFSSYEPSPMPLTDKWLDKTDFIRSIGERTYTKTINKGHCVLCIDSGDFSYCIYDTQRNYDNGNYPTPSKRVVNVHEFQNLYFALTGEELKISSNGN